MAATVLMPWSELAQTLLPIRAHRPRGPPVCFPCCSISLLRLRRSICWPGFRYAMA
jgi:hypothetical protein